MPKIKDLHVNLGFNIYVSNLQNVMMFTGLERHANNLSQTGDIFIGRVFARGLEIENVDGLLMDLEQWIRLCHSSNEISAEMKKFEVTGNITTRHKHIGAHMYAAILSNSNIDLAQYIYDSDLDILIPDKSNQIQLDPQQWFNLRSVGALTMDMWDGLAFRGTCESSHDGQLDYINCAYCSPQPQSSSAAQGEEIELIKQLPSIVKYY